MSRKARSEQARIFLDGEGDNWFTRNRGKRAESGRAFPEVEAICRGLAAFKEGISDILEIGCGDGRKLDALCAFFGARGKGIDPSQKAIEHGRSTLVGGRIELSVATADDLPFPSNSFDLVYFGFCLYLIDRDDLATVVSEANRVLRAGGFVAIFDFDPHLQHKRSYHHKEGVFSYKQKYYELFTASGLYHLVSKTSLSHDGRGFTRDGAERLAVTVLHKEVEAY